MADVRSLLRQERASRQQTAKAPKQSAAPAAVPTSKKRKAAPDSPGERKRTRTEVEKGVPSGFFDGGAVDKEVDDIPDPTANAEQASQPAHEEAEQSLNTGPENIATTAQPAPPALRQADEEDLDAFLKEMENRPTAERGFNTHSSGAVIEAAPMTAAEIAAQAREEQSAQRGKREEEMEAEKEEAARQLEDEFDEMEGLEERVRKLREKREALRKTGQAKTADVVLPDPEPADMEFDDSGSEDEDWDDWRFHPA